ncbi:hypothetical protein scyTo_0024695, partial [Scyliorhinus torazame]|nr:hypothetical protein [Scyliorhinus torazame]
VLDSIDPEELADFLSKPGFIDDYEILTKVLMQIKPFQKLKLFIEKFIAKTQNVKNQPTRFKSTIEIN